MRDPKPSEFFRSLALLAGGNIDHSLLKKLWMRKLPKALSIAVTSSSFSNVDDCIQLADKIWEVTNATEVCSLGHHTTKSLILENSIEKLVSVQTKLCEQFQNMSLEFCEIKKSLNDRVSRDITRSNSRSFISKSRSKSKSENWLCRYHYRYGVNARRCEDRALLRKTKSTYHFCD